MRSGFKYDLKQKFQDQNGSVFSIVTQWWKNEKGTPQPYYSLRIRLRGTNLNKLKILKQKSIDSNIASGKWRKL